MSGNVGMVCKDGTTSGKGITDRQGQKMENGAAVKHDFIVRFKAKDYLGGGKLMQNCVLFICESANPPEFESKAGFSLHIWR